VNESVTMNTIAFSSAGREIKQLVLHEPKGKPRAVVQIIHGMAEHYARYEPMAEYLAQHGFVVAGWDQIGHGPQTPADRLGYLGDYNGWQRLGYDVSTVHTVLTQRWPDSKHIILGHSMGSFVAREYAVQFGHQQLDGLVLSGTAWIPPAKVRQGLMLSRLVCALGGKRKPAPLIDRLAFAANNKPFAPARTRFDWLSRDEQQVDRYVADPLCGFVFTGSGYRELFRGLRLLTQTERLRSIPAELPVLFLSGQQDPVGGADAAGPRTVAGQLRAAGLHDVAEHIYPGARHELFNETNSAQVMADLLAWLERIA